MKPARPPFAAKPLSANARMFKGATQMLQLTIGDTDKGMSGYELASSLAGHLGWPVALCFAAFLFRVELRALIDRIKEVAHGETKVTFGNRVAKAEEALKDAEDELPSAADGATTEAKASAGPSIGTGSAPVEITPKSAVSMTDAAEAEIVKGGRIPTKNVLAAVDQVTSAPASAVTSAWNHLSKDVEALAERHGFGKTDPYLGRTFDTAKKLKDLGVFDTKLMVLLAELRKIRNAAAHGEAVDADGALRYIQLVSRFLKLIEKL